MLQQQNSDVQAELNALRQKLCELEGKYGGSEERASHLWWPRRFRKFLIVTLPTLLLASGGLLYAQSTSDKDALFINEKGQVGIGKAPATDLDVKGSAAFGGQVSIGAGSGFDATGQNVSLGVKGPGDFGNVAIRPNESIWQLAIQGPGQGEQGNARIYVHGRDNLTLHKKDQGNLVLQQYYANVGIGTDKPKEKLDVNGNVHISGTVAAEHVKPAWVSGFIKDDNAKNHKTTIPHPLKRIPTQIMLYFTPATNDERWYPVSLSRFSHVYGNPVTTEVTKGAIVLNIFKGNNLFETWDAGSANWKEHKNGYWVVQLY